MAAIGDCWASGSWVDGAWADGSWFDSGAGAAATLGDLTTLLVNHLDNTLYPATPTDDYNTLLARDIPTVRADAGSQERDLNTDYAVYLSD